MKINKWRLFGIHYAIVFLFLFFWRLTNCYTVGLIIDGEPVTWYAVSWDFFTSDEAPFINALWPSILGTTFYLYIFQELIQRNYKAFFLKFILFFFCLIWLNIFLGSFYGWLWSNYTYVHTVSPTPEELRARGELFKPFLLIFKRHVSIFFNISNLSYFSEIGFIVTHLLYTGFSTLVMYFFQNRKREEELQKIQRETEIKALKAQLNPHFLFNSLNTIYSSALEEKDTATAQLVQQLSGILRYSVEEVQYEQTDIKKEIMFVEKYLALQRARLPQHRNVRIDSKIFWDEEPAQVAPLLLIPFLENAFQYGISIDKPSFITVDLRVEDKVLTFKICNSISENSKSKKGAGTGLENAKKRLELLYIDQYKLHYGPQNETFVVDLKIGLKA